MTLTAQEASRLATAGSYLQYLHLPGVGTRQRSAGQLLAQVDTVEPEQVQWLVNAAEVILGAAEDEGVHVMIGPCGNLAPNGLCMDYENRPKVCREFVMGGTACEAFRDRDNVVPVAITPKPAATGF